MCGEPDVTPVVSAGGSALVGGLERERDCELRLVEVPGVVPPLAKDIDGARADRVYRHCRRH